MTAFPDGVDPHAVTRAKVLLLNTAGVSRPQRVAAYRLLARAESPAAYLPRLAEALIDSEPGPAKYWERTPAYLAACEEAAAIARGLDRSAKRNVEVLKRALDAYQHQLYLFGRRAEAFAVREELARVSVDACETGLSPHVGRGLAMHAVALAEEGRHAEAAEVFERSVAHERTTNRKAEASWWTRIAWASELDAAGRHHDAIAVLTDAVARSRRDLSTGDNSIAIIVWESVRLAQLLDQAGRHDQSSDTREDVLALLTTLADTGEPKGGSDTVSRWSTLLAWSGRADEPPAAPGVPAPALGVHTGWSPGVRLAFLGERTRLVEEITALAHAADDDPHQTLPALITTLRRLTIRTAFRLETAPAGHFGRIRPLFDAAVDCARSYHATGAGDAPALLARALSDRMTLYLAERTGYAEALADFRESRALSA